MSRARVVIDGTNAMHRLNERAGLGKAALAAETARLAARQFPGRPIDLVFDGHPFQISPLPDGVAVHFSYDQPADAVMLRLLAAAGSGRRDLITGDRDLAAAARRAGARTAAFSITGGGPAPAGPEKPEHDSTWQEKLLRLRFDE